MALNKIKGVTRWERDSPCLVLQWVDNKVVSLLSTIDRANDHGVVNRKRKKDGVWAIREGNLKLLLITINI